MNPIRQFQDRIEEAGLLPGVVLADGALHRCPVADGKPGVKDGVYKFHADPPCSGYFKNHKTGEEGTWTSSNGGERMSQEERERLRQKIKQEKAEGERKKQATWAATAKKAQALYAKAQECTEHAYLTKKGVDVVPGLKVMGGVLLVPRLNLKKEIISLVRIWADGTKKNLPGSYPPGGFFSIKGSTEGPLLICEGVSTGISLYMATGWTVVCSFDCGNLPSVAQGARTKYPDREIRICSDHDGATNGNPGLTYGKRAAQAIGAKLAVPSIPGKDKADFNDVHNELGLAQVKAQVEAAREVDPQDQEESSPDGEQTQSLSKDWLKALEIFPRVPMPWRIFPATIEQSLKQLARSCASSPLSLPGVALAIVAGAVGNLVSVCAKASWHEPLIFFNGDVRDSGDGKTSPLWALAAPLCKRQEEENKRAEDELQEYEALPKKEQKQSKRPSPARGYFATGLTLEGLRQDTNSPTGGVVIIMSELSSFVTSQNQYKGGGDDRESWLCLHDGKAARICRAGGRTAYIKGARPQVVGGIQPTVYKKAFTSQDGVFLTDGSLFRFLITHEPSTHFDLTPESWTDENRQAWENVINKALAWADSRTSQNKDQFDFNPAGPHRLQLSEEAQECFFDWRNDLSSRKHELPALVRGYIPKLVGYALRLTGALHLLRQFAKGEQPRQIISLEEIKDGVALAQFYGGQAVSALRLLQEEEALQVVETSERTLTLARTLADLKDQVDSGRLAIGLIQEEYNRRALATESFRTARSMGAFIRSLNLTISNGKHDSNGRRAVYCLVWDNKTDSFIADIADIADQSLHPERDTGKGFADNADIADLVSGDEVIV